MDHVSRRKLTKSAAWAVPAVALTSAAPSASASTTTPPSVRGSSLWVTETTYSGGRYSNTGTVSSNLGCSFTVANGPVTVSNLSMTYWLPAADYTFTPTSTTLWSTLARDTTQGTKVGPSTGLTYYPYTTTFAGTGTNTTTCGPEYSFASSNVTIPRTAGGAVVDAHDSYFYQFSYLQDGVAKTNPLQNPGGKA